VRFVFTARSELRKVLFLVLSVTFLFVYEISPELPNGFAPNSQRRRVWSLTRMSLKVKVKGQTSRSPGTKRLFSAFSAACVWLMFGKTSLAFTYDCCYIYLMNKDEYSVAQNKPDYLLLLSTFYISTSKHVSMIMYV